MRYIYIRFTMFSISGDVQESAPDSTEANTFSGATVLSVSIQMSVPRFLSTYTVSIGLLATTIISDLS